MQHCDLLITNASELLTCASGGKAKKGAEMKDLGIIAGGAVAVKDGRILEAGTASALEAKYSPDRTLDVGGRVVMPGFVECHTHLVFAGNRLDEFEQKIAGADYLEILGKGGGILSTVAATRKADLESIVTASRPRLRKMVESGVTTCEIKTGYGLDLETERKMLEAIIRLGETEKIDIIPTFLPAHAVPPEFKGRADDYVELICTVMLPQIASEILPGLSVPIFVDVFCEKNAFDLTQSKKILERAKELGFALKAHVDEFTNLGGARMAIGLGATSIDHLDAISDEEVGLLADSDTIGVVTPTVNFNLGAKEFADARKMIDRGCAIAVSTDYNPGSAPTPSPMMAMAIAARYQKMLPAETINGATINGAFAAGVGSLCGSIEPGKLADMLICDVGDHRELVHEFGRNHVERAIKRGEVIV